MKTRSKSNKKPPNRVQSELTALRLALHKFFNVTTSDPEVERPLRELLYGKPVK